MKAVVVQDFIEDTKRFAGIDKVCIKEGLRLHIDNAPCYLSRYSKKSLLDAAVAKGMDIMSNVNIELGAFSVSLNVKNLAASKKFYETLGFEVFHGDEAQNWLIMKNQTHVIGLFQGILQSNTLTFNPGWSQSGAEVNPFTDVRELQKHLKENGIQIQSECDETTSGPASFNLLDPDGNAILIDQHR